MPATAADTGIEGGRCRFPPEPGLVWDGSAPRRDFMALQGDLASVDLSQVFQMLALNQKVGLLSIQCEHAWKALYFDHRGVTLYYNEHTMLDAVLLGLTRNDPELAAAVDETRKLGDRPGESLLDSLLAAGWLTEDQVDQEVRNRMEEEIYDLFFWQSARFEFFEGATSFEDREGVVNERYFFSTDSLIMEAARRIDEWQFIRERVPASNEVYRLAADDVEELDLDENQAALLAVLDGKRDVARLIEETGLPAFHVYKDLALLLDDGVIEPVPTEDLVPLAGECMAEGRLQEAISLFEKALEMDADHPEAHRELARAYQALQEYELATYHLKCLAELLAADADVGGAVALLEQVIEILPTDLDARERLVELAIGGEEIKGLRRDPRLEGKELVDLYLEIGDLDRVRSLLEGLLRDNPRDIELKKSLITVHTRAGDTRRVIELYESIADDLVHERKPIEAVRYLHKVLMIDRSRRDVSERIRRLYEMDERRRTRRRSAMVAFAVILGVAVLGAGWYVYDRAARERLSRIDVTDLLERKRFDAAATIYKSFIDSYPLTIASRDAMAELARVESMRLAHLAEMRARKSKEDARLQGIRTKYRLQWERYLAAFDSHELGDAIAALRKIQELVAEAGKPEDLRWAVRKQIDKNLRDLLAYIQKASELEEAAGASLEAGDWREARDRLLELVTRYDMAPSAKDVELPVLLRSRPAGATVLAGGKPLVVRDEGRTVEVRTPAIVFCRADRAKTFELRLEGFEPARVVVDGRKQAEIELVLRVRPKTMMRLADTVVTPIGVGRDHLVAGLRGGRIAVARTDTARVVATIQLDALREVEGRPSILLDRFFFRTNKGEIAAYTLDGERVFVVAPSFPPQHDPIVRDGRIFFGDDEGTLLCLDATTGRTLWSKDVNGRMAGTPAVAGRLVRVGTDNGEVLTLDARDGTLVARHAVPATVTTEVLVGKGFQVMGLSDGSVVAVEERNGKLLWSARLERGPRPGEIVMDDRHVFVMGARNVLVQLDLRDGRRLARYDLGGRRLAGPLVVGDKVFVTASRSRAESRSETVLLALDSAGLALMWEYRAEKPVSGLLTDDGKAVYFAGPHGEVLRFE